MEKHCHMVDKRGFKKGESWCYSYFFAILCHLVTKMNKMLRKRSEIQIYVAKKKAHLLQYHFCYACS